MQNYVKENDLSQKPRKLLVGGLRAREMFISTELLKWYLSMGLEVTKVHQTVEYTPNCCFETFVDEVTASRRLGDIDKDKAMLADLAKLIG